jgi:hypothetical protein
MVFSYVEAVDDHCLAAIKRDPSRRWGDGRDGIGRSVIAYGDIVYAYSASLTSSSRRKPGARAAWGLACLYVRNQNGLSCSIDVWVPAFAGMTMVVEAHLVGRPSRLCCAKRLRVRKTYKSSC